MIKKWNKRVMAAVMTAVMLMGTSTTVFANASPPEGQEAAQEQNGLPVEGSETESASTEASQETPQTEPAPAEDGSGAANAMTLAMEEGGVTPAEVDYINAHGTSTHHNDLFETRAIKAAFGEAAGDVVINSTKSMIGHLLGAAGGVEFITCVKTIQDGFIHQTMGTKEADEECDLNYAIGAPVEKEVRCALTNSLGFGGHNATLLLKKYEG